MKISFETSWNDSRVDPACGQIEIVERKFRGHPDTMADLTAQTFIKKYIQYTWERFPELEYKLFPNCSADKISLVGATTRDILVKPQIISPIKAVLMGKITKRIGDEEIPIEKIFKDSVEEIFTKSLVDDSCLQHIQYLDLSVDQAGVDHHDNFYKPKSIDSLLTILEKETLANDTAFVVGYAPYSFTENLVRFIELVTTSKDFEEKFPYIGTDIKCMAIRNANSLDITLCVPVCPFKENIEFYDLTIENIKEYILNAIKCYIKRENYLFKDVNLFVNTKDTKDSKYFALWGSAISKGDIGCVGRGNKSQGVISAMRPSSAEAFSGKNPNHFSGVIYQLVADAISNSIYLNTRIKNVVMIKSNNGDKIKAPSHIHIICDQPINESYIKEIVEASLNNIDEMKRLYIMEDSFKSFIQGV